jgi:hypothetical protein
MPAAVHESAVGRSPCSVMKSRMAARAKSSADPALFEFSTTLSGTPLREVREVYVWVH